MAAPGHDYSTPGQGAPPPKKRNTILWVMIALSVGGLCLCIPILGAILFPVFSQAREAAKITACRVNMQSVGDAVVAYAEAHDGTLPKASGWAEAVREHVAPGNESAGCPAVIHGKGFAAGYSMNPVFAGKKLSALGPLRSQPLLMETADAEPGALGGASKPMTRHNRGRAFNVYYLDRGAVTERLNF